MWVLLGRDGLVGPHMGKRLSGSGARWWLSLNSYLALALFSVAGVGSVLALPMSGSSLKAIRVLAAASIDVGVCRIGLVSLCA